MTSENTCYDQWVTSIDLSKTKVAKFPSLILLCGGAVSNNGATFKSCRDIFHHYITENNLSFRNNVVLVEDVFKYFEHSSYNNLLDFEQDLAELSALTVLFSESPGAIAELGSFSVLKNIRDRLLVVIHNDDSDKESFIWRGPIKYLKCIADQNNSIDPIFVYQWRKTAGPDDLLTKEDFADAEDLSENIIEILHKFPKTAIWKKDNNAHVMLFILDLIKILQIASFDDIFKIIDDLSIDNDRKKLKRYLSLLLSLKFIIKKRYGHNVYYFPTQPDLWLKFAFQAGSKNIDFDRWSSIFTEYYKTNEIRKIRALRSHYKGDKSTGVKQ